MCGSVLYIVRAYLFCVIVLACGFVLSAWDGIVRVYVYTYKDVYYFYVCYLQYMMCQALGGHNLTNIRLLVEGQE